MLMTEREEHEAMAVARMVAKLYAAFYLALVGQGVPIPSATRMTVAYIAAETAALAGQSPSAEDREEDT